MRICYNVDSPLSWNDRGKRGNDKRDQACTTKCDKQPIWIHGDFATSNILM